MGTLKKKLPAACDRESPASVRLFYQSGKGVSVSPERNSESELVRKDFARNRNDLITNTVVL